MLLHQKMIVVSVAAVAGLMVAGAAYAQTSPQVPPPAAPAAKSPTQAPPPAGPPPAGQSRGMGRGQRGLGLTEAQRDQIRTGREAQRKDSQALREKMRTARQQLQRAMRSDVPDEAAIRSAAGAVASLQADQAVQRARARAQFMSVLTPEQQARMKQARARAAQRSQRPMWRRQQLRQDALRRWRGWI